MPPHPDATSSTIAVIGAGYVGLTTAAGFAALGHRVRVGESDQGRLEALRAGRIPISEPGLPELVASGVTSGLISFHGDNDEAVEGADAVYLTVPTPEGDDGSVDLGPLETAIASIGGTVRAPTPIVVKSSVPPGSSVRLEKAIAAAGSDSPLVINPEFLQEGNAVHDVQHPARVVVGSTDPGARAVVAGLHQALGAEIVETDPASAELTKYAANAYLATRLTFVNAISHFAESVGADVEEVLRGISLDSRIGGHYLRPGPGYGGSCFPKDLRALVASGDEHGHDLKLFKAVIETNDDQLERVLAKVADAVGSIAGSRVGVLGLAFKGGTDDTRNSPAVAIARRLRDAGAEVVAYDPAAVVPDLTQVADAAAAAAGADVIVVATEWEEFRRLDLTAIASSMRGSAVVDARNLLDPAAAAAAGLSYRGLGR